MKLTIVAASHRPASESGRVARYVEGLATREHGAAFDAVDVLDLGTTPLPLWDEDVHQPDPADGRWKGAWRRVSAGLAASQAFVFVVPEWSGMVPAALKNLFLLCGEHQLMHKPALIVGVSSGLGGSYPVAELRATSAKDTRICYIPDHVVVRQVRQVFLGPEPQSDHDRALRARLAYSLRVLLEYARALAAVRSSGAIDAARYPYGM